ncbi:MAG: hypothetical protein KBT33_14095, partial [Prevotellaceae bacterium]|nr:hypothetical protein [Candidatus Minthosoma equi]
PINLHAFARKKNGTKALAHATRLLSRWTKLLIHGTKALTGLYGFTYKICVYFAKLQKNIDFVKFLKGKESISFGTTHHHVFQ